MEIEKINIDGFGKFHKYNALTTDKIQVFFGKNEAGKTLYSRLEDFYDGI